MIENNQIEKNDSAAIPDHIQVLSNDSREADSDNNKRDTSSKPDTTSKYLPDVQINDNKHKSFQEQIAIPEITSGWTATVMPSEVTAPTQGQPVTINEKELAGPIDDKTQKALMKDADLYPPVQNSDGSTTYTVVMAGITDRPGKSDSIDYYSRTVNVTVPKKDHPSLNDCKYIFNERQSIKKEDYDKLVDREKAFSPFVEMYSHGVSTNENGADQQAFLLQLSTGRPTIDLDWNTIPHGNGLDDIAEGYVKDVTEAKKSNDNKAFQQAIDDTVQRIGADHTSMIGFSHGALFDARYLAHRAAGNMPKLDNVILAHPDVPLGAPELEVNGKPELLKDTALHSYVIGGKIDMDLKIAAPASLPGYPAFEWGGNEERLGDDADSTRDFIRQEGAVPLSEKDRHELSTQHFLNYAGIAQLMTQGNLLGDREQGIYNDATDFGRQDHGDTGGWKGAVSDWLKKAESASEWLPSISDFPSIPSIPIPSIHLPSIHLPSWLSF